MQKNLIFLIVGFMIGMKSIAANNSYATISMMNNNGTLCTQYNKHCGLFVSRATMNGAGTRDDGGTSGADGMATAKIICTEEGAFIDGGTHTWLPWLSTSTSNAATSTNLSTNGARYYRAGTALFVLDASSLTTTNSNRLAAPLDGTASSYWTGTAADGTSSGITCSDWSTTSGTGTRGYREGVNTTWTIQASDNCTGQLPVLCLQQIGPLG